jgi:hypothetical protein
MREPRLEEQTVKKTRFVIFFLFILQPCGAQTGIFDYFGQPSPGDTARLFAPEIVSLAGRQESGIVYSPDGSECYFNASTPGTEKSYVYFSKRVNGEWTEPQAAPFSNSMDASVHFISSDGNRLYLSINAGNNRELGFVERTEEGWSDPRLLPYPLNTASREMGYTQTADGVVYFDSDRQGGRGGIDIWRVRPSSDKAENLGPVINTSTSDFIPCIAPDGSFLIFSSWRSGGVTEQDLFISFDKGNQGWTAPVSMERTGAQINVRGFWNLMPSLSPDGKVLFYCHHTAAASRDKIDIYWVSTHVIVGLRKIAFAPKLNRQIPNMNIKTDSTLHYTVSSNAFSCEYGTETLQYSASSSNGPTLPDWLAFNPQTRTFSGKPTQAGIANIKITATNADTMSASCTFRITVTNAAGVDGDKARLPAMLRLSQNYPNPFNPDTRVRYALPGRSDVRLQVVDSRGATVRTLVGGPQNPGEHEVVWDSTDDAGRPAASGIYLFRLQADDVLLSRKALLIR